MKHQIDVVLHDDHELLQQLARELRDCARLSDAQQKFRQFSAALGGHLTAFKKVVYPGLKSLGWREVNSQLLVGHARLMRLFAELLTLKPDSASYADALSELLDGSLQLIEAERRDLLPLLSKQLDPVQRLTMGWEAQRYLAHTQDLAPADSRFPPSEWVEEAKLLLGGLSAA